MEKIIATIVIIVLTLGLISYAIIGQVGAFKDTSDQVGKSQARMNMLLNDSSLVTKNTVAYYINNAGLLGIKVYIGSDSNEAKITDIDDVSDNAIYKMSKTYNQEGSLATVTFKLEDLSS